MITLFKKEMRTYFTSMTGYIFLGFFVLMTAVFFLMVNILSQNVDYAATLSSSLILFLILIPTLTMRLFSEEMRQKTDQLIFTSPVTVGQIVIGKFMAALALFVMGMAITMIFPIIISIYGELPLATTIGAVVGYIFLAASLISVGLLISALTESQIIAAVASFAILYLFFIMDSIAMAMPSDRVSSIAFLCVIILLVAFLLYDSTKNLIISIVFSLIGFGVIAVLFVTNNLWFDGVIYKILIWFSLLARFDDFGIGVFNLADIVYYLTFIIAFIYLTINVIEKRRWK